jgi:peroxiredoxin
VKVSGSIKMVLTLALLDFVLALTLSCGKKSDSTQKTTPVESERRNTQSAEISRLSQPFPPTLLKDLINKVTPSDQILTGKNTVIIFISTTCDPCSEEIERWKPVLPNLKPPYQVIGISSETIEELSLYSRAHKVFLPLYSDPSGSLIDYFSISSYPTVMGVTPDRIVKFIRPGHVGSLYPAQYLQAF